MSFWSRLYQWEKITLVAFLLWLGAGVIFLTLQITPERLSQQPLPNALHSLRSFILACLQAGDPILILLAFATTYLTAARHWQVGIARRWALQIFAASLLIETLGTRTGFPFGAYRYTSQFGPLLGLVPITIPLAWIIILTNALFLVRRLAPLLPRLPEALAVGCIATVYDFILEPFATQVKQYWIWNNGAIPWTNYLAWFGLSATLIFLFAPLGPKRFFAWDLRPQLVIGGTVLLFVLGCIFR